MKAGDDELVTGAEVARRLSVSKTRGHQLAQRDDFPLSIGRIGASKVWRWADVERWALEHGRLERELATA